VADLRANPKRTKTIWPLDVTTRRTGIRRGHREVCETITTEAGYMAGQSNARLESAAGDWERTLYLNLHKLLHSDGGGGPGMGLFV